MSTMTQAVRRPTGKRPPEPKALTKEYRKWSTVNLTDARSDLDDTELFWCENAIPLGKGSIQILNGPGDPIATIAAGVSSSWGFTLNGSPVIIVVGPDGSLTQVTVPGGVTTVIGGANTVTALAHLTIWQGTTILILDPTTGYSSWDGTTYTVIDAARVGEAIAVFEGRAWLFHNRTGTFTAPNTFNDFTVGNGAGTFVITDEAFIGNVTAAISALEQLWIIGAASIEAISNVTASGAAPSVVTTFAITNIITGIGSVAANSLVGYLRAITFMSPGGGLYALSGVTPQQLSEKIDRMFKAITLDPDVPTAIAIVENLYCLLSLVTYTQANAPELPVPANGSSQATPLLLGFAKGKQFFASQNLAGTSATLKWITTVIVDGVSQAWGADTAGNIYEIFGGDKADPVLYKIVGKLDQMGKTSTTMKALTKVGVELQASLDVDPTLTIDSDLGTQQVPVTPAGALTLINSVGGVLTLINSVGGTLQLVSQGLNLFKNEAVMFGHYLGWTLTGSDPPFRLQAVQFEYEETRGWNA